MKSYMVLVEAEDYIEVEASCPEAAAGKAIEIMRHSLNADWKATVMHEEELS